MACYHYPEWIKNAAEELKLDYTVAYAYASENAPDGRTTEEWCRNFGVERCHNIDEVCQKSDVLLVLAPSNPETHLGFAKAVLPYGKPTYIDKTFAPDTATALEIFALAEAHHTPFFSSSALRYSTELDAWEGKGAKNIVTCGGSNAPEYIIHQAEMVIRLLKDEPTEFKAETQGTQILFRAHFRKGAAASMVYARSLPFGVCIEMESGEEQNAIMKSDSFAGLIRDILRFYETGKPCFDTKETINVMKLREGALRALETPETWVKLK